MRPFESYTNVSYLTEATSGFAVSYGRALNVNAEETEKQLAEAIAKYNLIPLDELSEVTNAK